MTYVPAASAKLAVVNASANQTLTSYSKIVLVDASGGAVSITLAAAAGSIGEEVEVIKTDSSANAVTVVAPAGATINGDPSLSITGHREGVSLRVIDATTLVASDDVKVDMRAGVKAVTANYTATGNDEVIHVDASGGAVTVTLPAMSSVASGTKAKNFYIKKTDGSANAVSVTRSGTDVIEQLSDPTTTGNSVSIATPGVSYNFVSNAGLTVWHII